MSTKYATTEEVLEYEGLESAGRDANKIKFILPGVDDNIAKLTSDADADNTLKLVTIIWTLYLLYKPSGIKSSDCGGEKLVHDIAVPLEAYELLKPYLDEEVIEVVEAW